jgi:benzoyl-CoA reductase subunit B
MLLYEGGKEMAKGQKWETKPLEFWNKAKELRAGWQKSIESKERVVGQGNVGGDTGFDWTQAFDALTVIEDNPVGAMMQNRNEPYARKARLASEVRGWGREICGYQGNCWGGQFLGYIEDGTPWPKRKLVVPMPCVCDQHGKRGAQARDYENMPQWMSDKFMYFGPYDEEREKPMVEHKIYCNLDMINDIERIFGQRFDEGKAVELMKASKIRSDCSKEICCLMARTIPTPLSVKDLYSVYTIGGLTKIDPEDTVKFWLMVRDEIKWRADNQIAAVGNEQFRWIETHPPSWHFMKYYRYMEEYGAVCLGSQYVFGADNSFEEKPDGSYGDRIEEDCLVPNKYTETIPLETREDIIRYGAGPLARIAPGHHKTDEYCYRNGIVKFAKFMQADGALLPIWRHGLGCTLTRKEQAMYLKEAGLSVMHYEGSQPGDRTDLDEKRFLDQLDTWMHSLGIRRG